MNSSLFFSHTVSEVILMAKQGMKRPEPERKKNTLPPVPELWGKARPLIPGGDGKVFHDIPGGANDLAADNLMNDWDMTAADLQDFGRK
jgi:hypothetical protein